MKNYLEIIRKSLQKKFGVHKAESLEYKELPYGDKSRFNITKIIGNKNLVAGRFKTEKEVDEIVNKFLRAELP